MRLAIGVGKRISGESIRYSTLSCNKKQFYIVSTLEVVWQARDVAQRKLKPFVRYPALHGTMQR